MSNPDLVEIARLQLALDEAHRIETVLRHALRDALDVSRSQGIPQTEFLRSDRLRLEQVLK